MLALGPGSTEGVQSIDAADTDSPDLAAHLAARVRDSNDCAILVWTSGIKGMPNGVPRANGDWEVLSPRARRRRA